MLGIKMRSYYSVWLALITSWIAIYSVRTAFSPAIPSIMGDLDLSYAEAGLASSAIFYTYASIQFLAGFLGARLGRRRMLLLGTALNGLGSLFTSAALTFHQLVVYRLLTGLGAGLIFSNDRPLIAYYTPREKLGLGQGLSFSGGGIGIMLGIIVGGLVILTLGWRTLFQLLTIPSIIALILIILAIEEPKLDRLSRAELSSIRVMIRSRDYLILVFSGIPIHYTFWVLAVWLPTILVESNMVGLAVASAITALLGVSAPIGLVALGRLSDLSEARGRGERPVLVGATLSLTAALIVITAMYQLRVGLLWILAATFAAGFAIWGAWAPHYRAVSRLVSGDVQPIAFGLMNGVHFLGSIISPYITGYLRDVYGDFLTGLVIATLVPLISSFLYLMLFRR